MMPLKFYAVAGAHAVEPDQFYWTISTDPMWPGWCTDDGCRGYGLTRAQAQFLADAANEKVAKDGDPNIPKWGDY